MTIHLPEMSKGDKIVFNDRTESCIVESAGSLRATVRTPEGNLRKIHANKFLDKTESEDLNVRYLNEGKFITSNR